MGVVRLLKRLASDGLMSVAMIATVAMTLILLSTGPIYADAVSLGAARSTLSEAPPSDTTVGVSVRSWPADHAAFDALVVDTVDARFTGVDTVVASSLSSSSFRLPERDLTELDELAVLRAVDDIAELTRVVDGVWPAASDDEESAATLVALDERIATELDLAVGDRFEIEATGSSGDDVAVEVSAVYGIIDPTDRRWEPHDDLLDAGSVSSLFRTLPFVAHHESILAADSRRLEAEWHLEVDIDSIDLDELSSLRRATARLENRLNDAAPVSTVDPSTDVEFEVETGLAGLLSGTERSITVTRSSIFGVVFQLAVLAGYALILTSAIAAETRSREATLLRSRGARPRDLTLLAAAEASLVAIPLAVVAPDVAAFALRLVDDVGPLASIGLRVAPRPTTMARVAALVGALVTVAVLVIPVLRGARRAEREVGSVREVATSASQRAGVDLALVGLTAVVIWQITTLGDDRTATIRGRFGVDPLLIVAPALGLLAGAVLALRVMPLAARASEALTRRSRGAVGALLGWQIARRPSRYARTMLLLVAAVSIGVLATTFTDTWRESQTAQATHEVGADIRLRPNRRTGDSIEDLQLATAYESIDGVSSALAISRWATSPPGSERRSEVLATQADRATSIVRGHDPATAASLAAAFDELARRRPSPATVPLPGEPHEIRATVEISEAEIVIDGEPLPPVFASFVDMVFQDGNGLLHRASLGSTAAGSSAVTLAADLTVTVDGERIGPEPPVSIVAIEARWVTPPVPERFGPLEATIDVSAITVIDRSGAAIQLAGLDESSWGAGVFPSGVADFQQRLGGHTVAVLSAAPSAIVVPTDDGVSMTVNSGFVSRQLAVVAAASPGDGDAASAVPVFVTERYLADSGSVVGDRLRLEAIGSEFDSIEIVGTVPSFPTVDPRRSDAIIADLPTLQLAALAPGASIRPPDEYWLDTTADHDTTELALRAEPYDVVSFVALDGRLDQLTTNPPAVGTLGAMSIGFVAAALFAIVGFAVSASVSARERAAEFATLRALGLSRRQLGRQLAGEQAIVASAAIVIGLAIGLGMSSIMLPRISLTQRGDEVFPALVVRFPWVSIGVLVVIVVVATVAVIAGVRAQVDRLDARRTRVGDIP